MRLTNKLSIAAILACAISPAFSQNPFTIKAELNKTLQGTAYLEHEENGKIKTEITPLKNGVFQFSGQTGIPSLALLRIKTEDTTANVLNKTAQVQKFYLEKGAVTLKGSSNLSEAVIVAGKSQEEYKLLLFQQKKASDEMIVLGEQMKKARAEMNDTAMKAIQEKGKVLTSTLKTIDSLFIKNHTDSYVAYNLWKDKHRGVIDPDVAPEFLSFSKRIQQTENGRVMAEKIELAKKLDIGKVAPDFSLNDEAGKQVSLSSLKGKNVLLCFWYKGFWGFNVFSFNLRKANRQLKDKNLVVLAVSYDTKEDWMATIAEQSMNYINVSDEGGIKQNALNTENAAISTVAKAYGLSSIGLLPQGFLIDTEGKIIARHLDFKDPELGSTLGKLIQ